MSLPTNANQWADLGGSFRPSPPTLKTIEPGYYSCSPWSMTLSPKQLHTDKLLLLEDSPTAGIVENIRQFWKAQARFKALGLLHKRGALLYGPPGSGKSAMIELLCQDIIALGGIVLASAQDLMPTKTGIALVRSVEKTRPIVALLEDVDAIIENGDEVELTQLLDGENQVENIVYLATTNYIDKIPPRIKNRPSRFDETILLGMPSRAARMQYLTAKLTVNGKCWVDATIIEHWADETEGFALAHLRELIVGVVALNGDSKTVLARLREMNGGAADAASKSAALIANEAGPEHVDVGGDDLDGDEEDIDGAMTPSAPSAPPLSAEYLAAQAEWEGFKGTRTSPTLPPDDLMAGSNA